ncbi:MAG: anti-sigma factor [Elusimicrobiota bacterium]
MSCKKFRIILSSYVDGELTENEKTELLKHLDTCSGCRAELAGLNKVKKIFTLRNPVLPEDYFETRLAARIDGYENQLLWRKYLPVFRKVLPVAISLFILVLGGITANKLFRRPSMTVPNFLTDTQAENNFDSELIEIYYGPENGQKEMNK